LPKKATSYHHRAQRLATTILILYPAAFQVIFHMRQKPIPSIGSRKPGFAPFARIWGKYPRPDGHGGSMAGG
jgi:hypothetical protein